jgi:hypothetical protein
LHNILAYAAYRKMAWRHFAMIAASCVDHWRPKAAASGARTTELPVSIIAGTHEQREVVQGADDAAHEQRRARN